MYPCLGHCLLQLQLSWVLYSSAMHFTSEGIISFLFLLSIQKKIELRSRLLKCLVFILSHHSSMLHNCINCHGSNEYRFCMYVSWAVSLDQWYCVLDSTL